MNKNCHFLIEIVNLIENMEVIGFYSSAEQQSFFIHLLIYVFWVRISDIIYI